MINRNRDEIVQYLRELILNDPVISAFCITSADRITGHSCILDGDKDDHQWWSTHDEVVVDLLNAVSDVFR